MNARSQIKPGTPIKYTHDVSLSSNSNNENISNNYKITKFPKD